MNQPDQNTWRDLNMVVEAPKKIKKSRKDQQLDQKVDNNSYPWKFKRKQFSTLKKSDGTSDPINHISCFQIILDL